MAAKPFMLLCNRQKMQKYYHISSVAYLRKWAADKEKRTPSQGKSAPQGTNTKSSLASLEKLSPHCASSIKKEPVLQTYVIVFVTTAWEGRAGQSSAQYVRASVLLMRVSPFLIQMRRATSCSYPFTTPNLSIQSMMFPKCSLAGYGTRAEYNASLVPSLIPRPPPLRRRGFGTRLMQMNNICEGSDDNSEV